jgi:hypothetical protein
MPKATWSQSSERYYQHRLKLHLINWPIVLWPPKGNQMSCQLSHHMIPLDITFIQVSSFSSFPCMTTIGSQQTWMDDGLDLDTFVTESLNSNSKMMSVSVWRLHTSYLPGNPTLPRYVPTYELTLPSHKPALSLPTSKLGIHPQRVAMNKPFSKGNEWSKIGSIRSIHWYKRRKKKTETQDL